MKLLLKDSYLEMIRNSAGSAMFRTLYAEVDGARQDILKGGDLSCAFFVSFILHQFKLIKDPHATVAGTVRDMEASGWTKVDALIPGAVVVWEKAAQAGGELHEHIGFALDADTAVSNSYKEHMPVEHHVTFGTKEDGSPARAIVAVYAKEGFL